MVVVEWEVVDYQEAVDTATVVKDQGGLEEAVTEEAGVMQSLRVEWMEESWEKVE